MPSPLYACCHVGVNLKYPSLIKTWVLETHVFQITVYVLELSYFQGQIMKATKALKTHSGCVSRYFYCLMEIYGKFQIPFLVSSDWRHGEKEKRVRKSLSFPHSEGVACYERYVFKLP